MARLRLRLIRNTHSGRASVSGSRSAHRHDLAGREIVGIRNWVLGTEWGIGQVRYCLMTWCLAGDADSAWSRCCEQIGAVFVETTSRIHARRV